MSTQHPLSVKHFVPVFQMEKRRLREVKWLKYVMPQPQNPNGIHPAHVSSLSPASRCLAHDTPATDCPISLSGPWSLLHFLLGTLLPDLGMEGPPHSGHSPVSLLRGPSWITLTITAVPCPNPDRPRDGTAWLVNSRLRSHLCSRSQF